MHPLLVSGESEPVEYDDGKRRQKDRSRLRQLFPAVGRGCPDLAPTLFLTFDSSGRMSDTRSIVAIILEAPRTPSTLVIRAH